VAEIDWNTHRKKGKSDMPNIASVMKEEIARLVRKELRRETERLKKASTQYRSDIAALKRRVTALEQALSRFEKQAAKSATVPVVSDGRTAARFSAKGLHSQRQRLGFSAADMGALLGVSPQTIYNWEAGTSRPRQQQVAAIAGVRGIGKREALARLSGMTAS
jgi:DNA-binding transcriptional regulator YiaG